MNTARVVERAGVFQESDVKFEEIKRALMSSALLQSSQGGVERFLATVPHAQFVELSDYGHTAAGDDNDAFSDAVVAFVTR